MSIDHDEVAASDGAAIVITHSASTDVGRVRSVNEDSYLAELPVFLVADGMGGHARGDAASRTVVETFRRHLSSGGPATPEQVLDAIHTANAAVRALSAEGEEGTAVAGTTLAGVALVDSGEGALHWMAFNVGDSRVYHWDGRRLEQVSVDHSAVQELVDAGVIDAADAETHPDRNVITRALGADDFVDPDVWLLPTSGRQTFLICSDGITKEVDVASIAGVLAAHGGDVDDVEGVAGELVRLAVDGGGRDNATAVVVESAAGAAGHLDGTTRDPGRGDHDDPAEDTRPRSGDAR
ncbi:PP2C family protein-serine/threonine phosphatase [Agromyces sp. MMS24-K17]|uniref:PP2C family protein-serine/threonine phosphatase n=1 Tax=Agromyces sp. MMS24-K17 TaxID=3372850 RepID=UPI0037549C91